MSQTLTGTNTGYAGQCTGPSPGDLVTAASINVGLQALLDDAQFLYEDKASRAGDTIAGAYTFQDDVDVEGDLTVINGGSLNTQSSVTSSLVGPVIMQDTVHMTSTSKTTLDGRIMRSARTAVGDPGAGKVIGLPGSGVDFTGLRFNFSGAPGAARVVKIDDSGVTPNDHEVIEAYIGVMASGLTYTFERLDNTVICEVWGLDDADVGAWIEFEYYSAAWHLGRNSGGSESSTYTGFHSVGVLPKAGA